jgi:hypothetical protein
MGKDVPAEVEEHLLAEYVGAGRAGGRVGAGAAGGFGGGWGAKLAVRFGLVRPKVERRSGVVAGTADEVLARVLTAHPDATRLPAEHLVRLAVPVGALGMQSVVMDLEFGPPGGEVRLGVTAYGMEGLLQGALTRKATDEVWAAASA